jgi:hypothetical protein
MKIKLLELQKLIELADAEPPEAMQVTHDDQQMACLVHFAPDSAVDKAHWGLFVAGDLQMTGHGTWADALDYATGLGYEML